MLNYAECLTPETFPQSPPSKTRPQKGVPRQLQIKDIGDDGLEVDLPWITAWLEEQRPDRARSPGPDGLKMRGVLEKSGDDVLLRGELRGTLETARRRCLDRRASTSTSRSRSASSRGRGRRRRRREDVQVPLRDPSRAGHEAAGAALRAVPALRRAQAAAPRVRWLRLLPRQAGGRGEGRGAALLACLASPSTRWERTLRLASRWRGSSPPCASAARRGAPGVMRRACEPSSTPGRPREDSPSCTRPRSSRLTTRPRWPSSRRRSPRCVCVSIS